MTESRKLLQHFLAALAYRTQKALRGAPDAFGEFRAGTHVRMPHELIWHMTGVIGYARRCCTWPFHAAAAGHVRASRAFMRRSQRFAPISLMPR